ncbi:hypothetical protein [Hydrogenimonas sp. SS33]|uniref:hypothetical protein n=1 Tax=Hydrogenimonas leucolamina TaxID=2954236 RepID=UPI00336BE07A
MPEERLAVSRETYIMDIVKQTGGDSKYLSATNNIVKFVKDLYRNIEPSHYNGQIVVFIDFSEGRILFDESDGNRYYDPSILGHEYATLIFKLTDDEASLPVIWNNKDIDELINTNNDFIAYVYDGSNKNEYYSVNGNVIRIQNSFSCPSIYALQYHDLQEALLDYKNNKVRHTSCELLKQCWFDDKRIYLKNKPEACMQISLKEFLSSRIRGINVVREYNLNASKPVDIRVFWKEANRAALIEIKWMGQSVKEEETIGTSYSNGRANDGMSQIKEYIDYDNSDSPDIITKGYLVVIDCRRRNISLEIKHSINREDGLYYENKKLDIQDDRKYWETYTNIEKPFRMFAEPICE